MCTVESVCLRGRYRAARGLEMLPWLKKRAKVGQSLRWWQHDCSGTRRNMGAGRRWYSVHVHNLREGPEAYAEHNGRQRCLARELKGNCSPSSRPPAQPPDHL